MISPAAQATDGFSSVTSSGCSWPLRTTGTYEWACGPGTTGMTPGAQVCARARGRTIRCSTAEAYEQRMTRSMIMAAPMAVVLEYDPQVPGGDSGSRRDA